jgi:hypothetical protein
VQIRIRAIITARVFGAQRCSVVFISQEVQQTLLGAAALCEYVVSHSFDSGRISSISLFGATYRF